MPSIKALVRKAGKKIIPLFVPENSWKLDYITFRGRILCSSHYRDTIRPQFEEMLKNYQGTGCPKNQRTMLDFWLCWVIFGVAPYDYFDFEFFRKGWKWRDHHVTRQRLNFLNSVMNAEKHWDVVDNKASFYTRWSDFVRRRWCLPHKTSREDFIRLFETVDRMLVKPTGLFGGKGIYSIDLSGRDLGEIYDELIRTEGEIIAEEYVYQKGFLNEIHPQSLNTLRVCTARVNGKTDVCYSFFLTGCSDMIVSNGSSGGICYEVNVKTGVMSPGTSMTGNGYIHHPDTGIQVAGQTVPHWEKVKAFACKAHELAPEDIRLIGWDVCLSGEELSLIEGNTSPGFAEIADRNDDQWEKMKKYMDEICAG